MESFASERPRRGKEKEQRGRGRDRNRRDAAPQVDVQAAVPQPVIEEKIIQPAAIIDIAANGGDKLKAERKQERAPRNFERNHNTTPPANDDNRRRHYRDHDDGPTPVGFGDDIPAFMLIVANAKA